MACSLFDCLGGNCQGVWDWSNPPITETGPLGHGRNMRQWRGCEAGVAGWGGVTLGQSTLAWCRARGNSGRGMLQHVGSWLLTRRWVPGAGRIKGLW
jgi:hypothetical protein